MGGRVLYVSGPITAGTGSEMEANIRVAEAASARLFRAGVTNICVHAQGRFMDGIIPHAKWLEHDYRIIDRCEGVYLCTDTFAHSKGTMAEVLYARRAGKPVFQADDFEAAVAWALGGESGEWGER